MAGLTLEEFTGTLHALVAAGEDDDAVAVVVNGDPRKQALADWLADARRDSPPLTARQKASIRSVLRSARQGAA